MEPFRSNETFFYGASHARLNLPLSYLHKTAKIGSNSIETYNLDWRREWMLCISIPSMKINKWVLSNIASSLVAGWRGEWWEQILQILNSIKLCCFKGEKNIDVHTWAIFTSPVSLFWTHYGMINSTLFSLKVFEGQRAFITRVLLQFHLCITMSSFQEPLSWRRFRLTI